MQVIRIAVKRNVENTKLSPNGSIYNEKRMGAKIEPCGTPHVSVYHMVTKYILNVCSFSYVSYNVTSWKYVTNSTVS